MSVWYCIPSARPAAEANQALLEWIARGYKVALWVDSEKDIPACHVAMFGAYPGYAAAVNTLAKKVIELDPECTWIVTGGDDTLPDPSLAPETIAAECTLHFRGTLGVMQPTGDRYADGSIDRIAGSPWLGREWCLRGNGGAGAFWPEFTHMFGDECLQRTAQKCGLFWQRRDLVHLHRHFMRETNGLHSNVRRIEPPAHLKKWNSRAHWQEMQTIFERLRRCDFVPCMPLSVTTGATA